MEKPKSRILIVEDEALITTHLERIATKSGYDVLGIKASGEEALQLLEEALPDLILMDINLAGELNGIETAAQIHEWFDIPIVYLTGYTEEVVVQQAKITKPFGYVAKPIRERELCATIEMDLYPHQLETQLKESEEKYRLLVEQPIAGITIVQDHRIVFANQAFAEMLGYSIEELYAMSAEDVLALGHPEDQELRKQYHRDRLAGKPAPKRYVSRYIRKDGTARWMETAAHLTKYQDRPAVQAFFLDVTERKQAEEALEESHSRLLTILDSIDADVYVADVETYEILFINEHMRSSFGENLVGKICWKVFQGGSGPCAHCTNDQLLDDDGNPTGVVIWQGQNPITEKWYISHDRAIKWIDGRLVRLQIATDITEHKRTEKELRTVESLQRTVIDSLDEALHLVDNELCIRLFNRKFREWSERLGFETDPVGKHIEDVFPFLSDTIISQYQQVLTTGEPLVTHEETTFDGRVIFTETRKIPVKTGEKVTGVLTIIADITEHKHAEKQLEASLREKEVLLEEIYHRVKNNFAVIYGLLDIQADYVQDKQSRKVFRDSQHRLQTMALIHEQLYATPDLVQIDFTDYVYTLTTDLFATYRLNFAHPVEAKLNVHDVFLEIKQAIPCGMIINELVSNALKYAFPATSDWPPGFVGEVCVTFHPADEGKYELIVSDNGVGLPADFGDDTLGLFLIDRFVQQLDGTIEWQRDGGTTCRIMFARQ